MYSPSTPLPAASAAAAPAGRTAAPPLDLAGLVGPDGWARLPAAVRRRFAAGHADTVYEGHLDLACSALGRCFARLAGILGGPLTPVRARDVPTCVRVHGDGQGGVVWERRFAGAAGAAARVVRSTKLRGPGATVIERTDGGLAMLLDVYEEQGALVFRSRCFFWSLGRWRLPIPGWLTPGVCRVEHRDAGNGRFRFTLEMVHPLWGRSFHQTGLFTDPEEA
ncbi:MAG TPA: DUF4166 domain-containing protein [Ideonella sp.]|nr:DUF4166 domain-containing protein [Ideonella sp.]